MIKAIIFDVYGVLVTDGWHPFKFKYFKDDPEKDAEASRLNDLTNKGALGYQEFLQTVGELAGVKAREVQGELSKNAPNLQLFDYISTLKPTYKIGLLSNAAENRLDRLFTPGQYKQFDATVLSCDIAANKPEASAYSAIADKLGCELSECVFVDDIKRYVDGAIGVGMQAILYKFPEQVISDIRAVLATDVNN